MIFYQKGRSLNRLLFLLLLSKVFVHATAAQMITATDTGLGGQNLITGTVLTAEGRRLETRIPVRLVTPMRGDRIATTDEYGHFGFRGLASGDYVIVIDKEKEYEAFSQSVSIIQPRSFPPQTYNVNVRLKLKGGTAAKPAVINAELAKVPKHALDTYNNAIELSKAGNRKGAIEQLQKAIAEYSQFTDAYNEMGVQYLKLGELQKADEAFQSALKIDPKAFGPMMNRGIVLVTLKRWAEAEPLLREVVKMKDDQAVGHYFLGQAVAYQGKFEEADSELSIAIKLGGDEMKEAHRLLAIICSARGDKKRAAEELETYLRLVPTAPDAEQLRKVMLQMKGSPAPTTASPAKEKPSL